MSNNPSVSQLEVLKHQVEALTMELNYLKLHFIQLINQLTITDLTVIKKK